MSDINVISRTQKIIVDAAANTVSVSYTGPAGPTGPTGPAFSTVSPTFTGIPAAPTATAGTSTTQLATTAFVTAADQLMGTYTAWTPTGVTWVVGNGTWSAFYARVNNLVHIYGTFTWGSTSSITGSLLIGGLPANIDSAMFSSGGYGADFIIGNATYQTSGTGGAAPYLGIACANSLTQIRLWVSNASGTYLRSTATTATVPFAWATGDNFRFSAFYEAA
jgi:hypothetical protein